jgi:alpha-L-rhamnosidase
LSHQAERHDWLYQKVAGIEAVAPGYTKVEIRPFPVGDLRRASATVASPLGQVRSAWTRDRGRFTLRVSVPVGATGEVFVPVRSGDRVVVPAGASFVDREDGYVRYRVGSGTYEFRAG